MQKKAWAGIFETTYKTFAGDGESSTSQVIYLFFLNLFRYVSICSLEITQLTKILDVKQAN